MQGGHDTSPQGRALAKLEKRSQAGDTQTPWGLYVGPELQVLYKKALLQQAEHKEIVAWLWPFHEHKSGMPDTICSK